MKKPLAALALIPAAVVALAIPAGAAVPNKPASFTVPCHDGSGKRAQVWVAGHRLAATNPCTGWINLPYGNIPFKWVEVAPGAHFNWSRSETASRVGPVLPGWGDPIGTGIESWCDNGTSPTSLMTMVYSYKDVRRLPPC